MPLPSIAVESPFDLLLRKPLRTLTHPTPSTHPQHPPANRLPKSKSKQPRHETLPSQNLLLCEILHLHPETLSLVSPSCRSAILQEAKLHVGKWPDLDSWRRVDVLYAIVMLRPISEDGEMKMKDSPGLPVLDRRNIEERRDEWWQSAKKEDVVLDLPSRGLWEEEKEVEKGYYESSVREIAYEVLDQDEDSDDEEDEDSGDVDDDADGSSTATAPSSYYEDADDGHQGSKLDMRGIYAEDAEESLYPYFMPKGGIMFFPCRRHSYSMRNCEPTVYDAYGDTMMADSGFGSYVEIEGGETGAAVNWDWEMVVEFEERDNSLGNAAFEEWKIEARRQCEQMRLGFPPENK